MPRNPIDPRWSIRAFGMGLLVGIVPVALASGWGGAPAVWGSAGAGLLLGIVSIAVSFRPRPQPVGGTT